VAEVASAYVTLMPSAKGFGGKIQSQVGGDLDKAGKAGGQRFGAGMSSGLAGVGSKVFAPLAAAAAAIGVGNFLKDAIGEARESQKVGALTASIIKSTGGAAKITAGQVGDLATAISNKTGMDDEAIQSGANLLLTFKNVKNELGSGNQIFDRATAAAADLSAAGFGDLNGASKQLGKALNDPIKGISALGRAGVTFTDQQKAQIKTLVKSGNTLQAQKIILKEVESQVGGAAAASATAGEKFAVTFGNFKESIGTALLPVLDMALTGLTKFFGYLTANVGPAFARFGQFVQPAIDTVKLFIGAFTGAGSSVELPWMNTVIDLAGSLRDAFDTVVPAIRSVFASFQSGGTSASALTTAFAAVSTFIRGQVIPAVAGVLGAYRNLIAVALPIVQAFVAGMMARITPLLPGIRAVFTQVGSTIVSILNLVKTAIGAVTAVIAFIWRNWGQGLMNFLAATFGNIINVVRGALNIVQGIIKTVTSLIKGDWSGAWDGIKQIVSGAWTVIKAVVSQSANVIKTVLAAAWSVIKAGASAAWSGIKAVVSAAMSALGSQISASLNAWKGIFSAAWSAIKSGVSAAWSAIKSTVSSGISSVVSTVQRLPGAIAGALGNLGGILVSAGQQVIQGFINGITGAFGAVKAKLGELTSMLPDWKGPAKRDKTILTPAGQLVIQSFIDGIAKASPDVKKILQSLTSGIAKIFADRVKTKDSALIKALRDEVARLGPLVKKHKATAKQLKAARKALDDAMNHKGKASDIGFAAATAVMNGLKKQTDAAANIAKQRTAVAAKLKVAQDKLAAAVKLKADFAASVRAQAAELGNVVKNSTATSQFVGGQDIVASLKSRLAAMTKFAKDVAKLKAMGLNNAAYQQIIEAGVDGGGAEAAAGLLAGGKKVVGQVNTLQGQINSQGKKLGDTSSKVLYQAGVDSAKGLVKGLESQAKALAAASKRVANTIVKAIKKALGIKSPSRVMAKQVGKYIPLGMVRGIDSERAALDKSMRSLVSVPKVDGSAFASKGQALSQGGGTGRGIVINGNVGWDPEQLARETDKRDRNNMALAGLTGVTV